MSEIDDAQQPGAIESSSPEQQTIPKYRLDEEISKRRSLEAQVQIQQEMLRNAVPQRQQQPEAEPEALRNLKERDPEAYKIFKMQERRIRETSASNFSTLDRLDKHEFVNEFGPEGKDALPEVEAKLEELRQRGIHHFNRGQIYVHLKGVEHIENKRKPQAKPNNPPAPQAPAPQVQDVPSSDVRSAGVSTATSGAAGSTPHTIEDLENRLKDVEF